MKKIIHYCWFGGNKISKLTQKCIKSWKKFLPDFEIKFWNEDNVDLDECTFVREAYNNKKWAFVADFVRSKVMYEMGGIYLDTDMEILKPINDLLESNSFIGVEDSGYVACGVWYEANPKSGLSKYLYDYYKKQTQFDVNNLYEFSIPKLITGYLERYGFEIENKENQLLKNGMMVYKRDYFYPLSFNRQNNIMTNNTCMIHYYDASWIPKGEKRSIQIVRRFGNKGLKVYNSTRNIAKKILFPIVKIRQKKHKMEALNNIQQGIDEEFNNLKNSNYIVFVHKYWMGVKNATQELFENIISLTEDEELCEYVAKKIIERSPKLIIFSGFCLKWDRIVSLINEQNENIIIKVLWHGSNAMHVEEYDWKVFKTIFNYLDSKKIQSIGFVKKTMYELYKKKNYNVEFVMNTVHIDKKYKTKKDSKSKKCIGVYASGDRWVKNFYNQLAGVSLVEGYKADIIPLSEKTKEFAKIIKLDVSGSGNVSRQEMYNRLSSNDVNIYVTFVECAPVIPLESLELGVPCITSNNHHYWENTELGKYLILDKCEDPQALAEKIKLCIKNKAKILKLYEEWKKEYDSECEKNNNKFLI